MSPVESRAGAEIHRSDQIYSPPRRRADSHHPPLSLQQMVTAPAADAPIGGGELLIADELDARDLLVPTHTD